MNTLKLGFSMLALAALLVAPLRPAQAVAETWVSHSGNDGNPCTPSSPCLTFAGAYAKTSDGGEIDVLDSGSYGPVAISKSITIDGGSSHAVVNGMITVSTGGSQQVVLRHLTFAGAGQNNYGLVVNSSGTLTVDNCAFSGYTYINIELFVGQGGGNVVIQNTTITGASDGIRLFNGAGTPGMVLIRNVTMHGCGQGLLVDAGVVDITNSLITQNSGYAIEAVGGTVNVSGCTLSDNGYAIYAGSGSTIRLTLNNLWNNTVGIDPNGAGIVATAQDNRKAGNTTAGAPTPGHTIAIQ